MLAQFVRAPKQRSVRERKMKAREKREMMGVIAMIFGAILIVAGLLVSFIEWDSLSLEKLALMAIVEGTAPGLLLSVIGLIFFGIGLGVYFASCNEQAWRRAKRLLPV
jgi:hypothetical protein